MSFLNKITAIGQRQDEKPAQIRADDAPPFGYEASTMQQTAALDIGLNRSIITEAAPSEARDNIESRAFPADVPDSAGSPGRATARSGTGLPLIGKRPVAAQQRILLILLIVGFVGSLSTAAFSVWSAQRGFAQVKASGQALVHSQRLAASVSQSWLGSAAAFARIRESANVLVSNVRSLRDGQGDIAAAPSSVQAALEPVLPLVERAEKNAATLLTQQKALTQMRQSLLAVSRRSSDLLAAVDSVGALKLQQGASPTELAAVAQLAMLTQRVGKSTHEFLTLDGPSPETVLVLTKDLKSFREIGQGLLDGNAEQRLPITRDPQTRERLGALLTQFEQTHAQVGEVMRTLPGVASARAAQASLLADTEQLRTGLEDVQQRMAQATGFTGLNLTLLLLSSLLLLLGGGGLLRLYVRDQTDRRSMAEAQHVSAEHEQQEAKRVNDANQAAILRLMNELQAVAEGDLTQQATVTEDITGAIADSVNYTVEELRTLVAQVQSAVSRVAHTTEQVDVTSTELLATSSEQLREIRDTGESVLQMAGRIIDVSGQAQETAAVARQSLSAAELGLRAVQNTIGGMNSIRDQIQETSKRIKRLGESSQEIGEITELISDLTEQTNVLALNAAIQAASAGDAGRGFSVVAEEVQRLAERSADATRQIAALVKTIQTDTQDAVGAMERSTQGVVEGTRLSDAAGTALGDIDRVSRRLAELIERISSQALSEAQSANVVAANIQHIFAVTEQTGEGTRSTAHMVRELSRTAEELRQSVARFKIV